jgi:hypothetical protein
MSLRSEAEEFRQPDRLVTPKSEQPGNESQDATGNGWKYWAMLMVQLVRRDQDLPSDRVEFHRLFEECCPYRLGIPNRSPTKTGEQIAKDDLIAIAWAGKYLDPDIARAVLRAGRTPRFFIFRWFYKNVEPEKFPLFKYSTWQAWMGRSPEVIAHFHWSAGIQPGLGYRLYQALTFYLSGIDSADGVTNAYMMADTAFGQCGFLDRAILSWLNRVNRRWGSVQGAVSAELQVGHPIALYWLNRSFGA